MVITFGFHTQLSLKVSLSPLRLVLLQTFGLYDCVPGAQNSLDLVQSFETENRSRQFDMSPGAQAYTSLTLKHQNNTTYLISL